MEFKLNLYLICISYQVLISGKTNYIIIITILKSSKWLTRLSLAQTHKMYSRQNIDLYLHRVSWLSEIWRTCEDDAVFRIHRGRIKTNWGGLSGSQFEPQLWAFPLYCALYAKQWQNSSIQNIICAQREPLSAAKRSSTWRVDERKCNCGMSPQGHDRWNHTGSSAHVSVL